MTEIRTAAILFGGIGGFSAGLKRSVVEAYGKVYRWEILCSIDFDPVACRNHDIITGEQTAVQMDLFNRDQYRKWFGHEPPAEWQEATPQDIWQAFKEQVPDYIFLSPPCKGFSGLLPEKSARSAKYQALNLLTIRGLELCLEACVRYGDGVLPAFIHFENVPRITSRGADILARIKRLLERYGYAVDMRSDHNLGEIGGLGQNRMRFLLLARNQKRVPNWCYLPPKKPLKTIGDVLGPLPMPDDPAGGPMHRLPRLQWKTWVRLALIPAGGDWRDLNEIDWQKYRIVSESGGTAEVSNPRVGLDANGHAAIYRVVRFDEPAPCITGAHRPNNGAIVVSDPRLRAQEGKHPGVYRVVRMDEPSPTVTGTRFCSGAPAIADPRVGCSPRSGTYGVMRWDEPAKTVIGAGDIHAGATAVADPRMPADTESGVWVIISEDCTWHRPLTTYELAMLQGFPSHLPDGRPFQLEGCSDAKAREYIGNAVPVPAAEAMGNVIMMAIAQAEAGITFEMSWNDVWVLPEVEEQPAVVH